MHLVSNAFWFDALDSEHFSLRAVTSEGSSGASIRFRECAKRKARASLRRNAALSRGAAEGHVRRPTPRRRELRAIVRAAIADELRALYRVEQDAALPERMTDLLRQLDLRIDEASSGDTGCSS